MNRAFSILLFGCFFISIWFQWISYTSDSYELSKLLIIGIVSGVLWMKLSYSDLMLKSAAFIVFIDAIWNVGQFFMNGAWQGPLELINILIFVPWFAWALHRSYEIRSVPIEDGKVYWITHKPDDKWSFITSLFGGPVGGYSLYMNGTLYGYKKGQFVERSLNQVSLNIIAVESDAKESQELETYLSSMKGLRWSLMNNCITLRLKVWWKYA